eukprot:11770495-Alexandrium_andersonii.AAC.1
MARRAVLGPSQVATAGSPDLLALSWGHWLDPRANAIWRTLGALRRWALSSLAACQSADGPLAVPHAVAGPLQATLSEWGARPSGAPSSW